MEILAKEALQEVAMLTDQVIDSSKRTQQQKPFKCNKQPAKI